MMRAPDDEVNTMERLVAGKVLIVDDNDQYREALRRMSNAVHLATDNVVGQVCVSRNFEGHGNR